MEVRLERSNASPDGLTVSSTGLRTISPEGLRFPRKIKLSHGALTVSSGGLVS